jgi:hypothetical protein
MKTFITRVLTRTLIVGLLAGLIVGTPLAAQTSEKEAKSEATSRKAKSDLLPIRGKIGAVNPEEKTITLDGKGKSRVIQVRSDTKLTKDGQPATLDAAIVGEEIAGQVRKVEGNKFEALSLRFGPRPQGKVESKPTKKTSRKKESSKAAP